MTASPAGSCLETNISISGDLIMPSVNSIACVILAAGEGTRMKSRFPKVAHRLAGTPLITHVLRVVTALAPERILVVVPSKGKVLPKLVRGKARCVFQEQLLGTGHALMQNRAALADFTGNLLVLSGDVPLITTATLRQLLDVHRAERWDATILTARLKNPTGYGRVIRKSDGKVAKIVEETDADFCQKDVEEVNSGTYCFRCPGVWPILDEIKSNNRQGEYYLTDAIQLLSEGGGAVGTVGVEDPREIWGINTLQQLARAETIFQQQVAAGHQNRGVTIVLPEMTYIEDGVEIGPETVIYPFTVVEQDVRIGRECRVGPFVYLQSGTVVPDGSEIKENAR